MKLYIQPRMFGCGFACVFDFKGQEYLADITFNMDFETECMIFKSENGQFSFDDAMGEYRKTDIPLTPSSLRDCIEEFVASLS